MSAASPKPLARTALLGLSAGFLLFGGVACDVVKEVLANAKAPSAALARVDLVDNPSVNTLMSWSCHEYIGGTTCSLLGFDSQPNDNQLRFSFDVVFDLLNPNSAFSIPLIETLVGIDVFDGDNLGAVCVSFCDPGDPSCEPDADAAGSCDTEGASDVMSPEDLVPTVDQFLNLATDVATGTLDDNWDYRVIPSYSEQSCQTSVCTQEDIDGVPSMCCDDVCEPLEAGCSVGSNDVGESCALCDGYTEAHIQFDFDVNAMMGLFSTLLEDGIDDLIAGRAVSLEIPYMLNGTLFFDVPELGRHMLGYGPYEDVWPL